MITRDSEYCFCYAALMNPCKFLPALLLIMCLPALAQSNRNVGPGWELGVGYQYLNADTGAIQKLADEITVPPLNIGSHLNMQGFNATVQQNKAPWWGGMIELSGDYGTKHFDAYDPAIARFRPDVYTAAAGPQFMFVQHRKIQPFVRALGGVAHSDLRPDAATKTYLRSTYPTFSISDSSFALIGGVGADYVLTPTVSFRVAGDYERTWLFEEHQGNFKVVIGAVFKVGGF